MFESHIWLIGDGGYLEAVSTPYYKNESVAARIYKTSKLYVNDVELSDSYITKDGITTDSCKRLPEGLEGIMLREYEVKDLLLAPKIKVINRFGAWVFGGIGKLYTNIKKECGKKK